MLPAHGFVYFEGDKFIVSELTQLWVRSKSGREFLKAFLVVNNNGERQLQPLGSYIDFEDKKIAIQFGDRIEAVIPTLVKKETIDKFLEGETPAFKDVFEEIRTNIENYVNFVDSVSTIIATCRVIESYFVDVTGSACIILFDGLQGSDKTRANLTLTYMSRKGLMLLNPSDASTFKIAEALMPTMGIDEEFTPVVRLILKGGYKKGLGVARMEKKANGKFSVRLFNPFTCYNLSVKDTSIFDDQTRRRIVKITMVRNPTGISNRDPTPSDFEEIRELCYLLRLTRAKEFKEKYEEVREKYREKLGADVIELWGGLLTIASLVGENIENELVSEIERRKTSFYEENYRDQRFIIEGLIRLKFDNKETDWFLLEDIRKYLEEVYTENAESEADRKRLKTNFQTYYKKQRIGRLLSQMGIKGRQDWSEDKKDGKRSGLRKYPITWEELHRLCIAYYPDHERFDEINTYIPHVSVGYVGYVGKEGEELKSKIEASETPEGSDGKKVNESFISEKKEGEASPIYPTIPTNTKDIEGEKFTCSSCEKEYAPLLFKPYNEDEWICVFCWIKNEGWKLKHGKVTLSDFLEGLKEFTSENEGDLYSIVENWSSEDKCKDCIDARLFYADCSFGDEICQQLLRLVEKSGKLHELEEVFLK